MVFTLKPSKFFLEQIGKLPDKTAKILSEKLKLIKLNPFRNKRIKGFNLFL